MNNFTLSYQTDLGLRNSQRKKLHNVIDTTALYEAIYLASKLFPKQGSRIENNFSFKIDRDRVSLVGMGLEKDLSMQAEEHQNINYSIYGKCLSLANKLSSSSMNTTFVVPGNQTILNSVVINDFDNIFIDKSKHSFSESTKVSTVHRYHNLVQSAKLKFEELLSNDPDVSLVDHKDLIYQCLFRLMSFNPNEYCEDVREEFFFGVPYHETNKLRETALFLKIYMEQKAVLLNEYYDKEQKLFQKLNTMLNDYGKLKIIGSKPYLVTGGETIALELKEIDKKLANRIHKSFHYIHTPRNSGYVLGLFIKGDELPISTIGVEKVDRDYKKIALMRHNISPDHAYELTRMYSCKNSPSNTSSFMLAITNSYLKNMDSKWQASISSFMPSYATGLSMTSGGFKDVLYVKPCKHNYEQDENGNVVVRTNRSKSSNEFLTNQTKVMPVIELIHTRNSFLKSIRNDKYNLRLNNE